MAEPTGHADTTAPTADPDAPGKITHRFIAERMKALPRGRVLDLPTGAGALASLLMSDGFDVTGADIDRGRLQNPAVRWQHCNLNEPMPFADGEFDYVTFVAGAHRVYHLESVMAEFHRVLKPGGRLLLAQWNHGSIRRRLRFLSTGSVATVLEQPRFVQTVGDRAAHFRQILLLPRLWHDVEQAGFVVERVDPSERIAFRPSYLFWLPIIWLGSRLSSRGTREKTRSAEGSTFGMLLSRAYLLTARKKA